VGCVGSDWFPSEQIISTNNLASTKPIIAYITYIYIRIYIRKYHPSAINNIAKYSINEKATLWMTTKINKQISTVKNIILCVVMPRTLEEAWSFAATYGLHRV
jgi:hypothetical protein